MIKAYLRHLFAARKACSSIHSPFISELCHQCIRSSQTYYAFRQIEQLRKSLYKNQQAIQVNDLGAGSRKNFHNERKISKIARHSISSRKTSQLLFKLINKFQPSSVLELGTSLGINTLYLAKALHTAQIITLEGCSNIAQVARQNFAKGGCTHIELLEGDIDHTLPTALDKIASLDFVFFDANHRYAPTIQYFELCLRKAHKKSIFVFDDIYWSSEMQQAWAEIKAHPQVTLSLDLFQVGLVFFESGLKPQHFKFYF